MYETLLNFISGAIIGTIFLFIIMFFLIFMRWFRPVPRVSIPKNIPLESTQPQTTTETINWIKLLSNSKYFEYFIQKLFSFGLQKYIEQIFPSDDYQNIKIEVFKCELPTPDFTTVETTDPIENGTVISAIPLKFSNPLSIELNIILNDIKKVKCTISTLISKADLTISIPYETGLIIFELKIPSDTKFDFKIDSIQNNEKEESSLNTDENDQINKIKQTLCENLIYIKLPIDIDTVPVEEVAEVPPAPQESPQEENKPEDNKTEESIQPEKIENKAETKEKINEEEEYESDSDIIKGPLSFNLRHHTEFNSLQKYQNEPEINKEMNQNESDHDDTEFVTIELKPTERGFSVDNPETDEKNDENTNDTDSQ